MGHFVHFLKLALGFSEDKRNWSQIATAALHTGRLCVQLAAPELARKYAKRAQELALKVRTVVCL